MSIFARKTDMRHQAIFMSASILGAFAVIIGAFGAHALETILEQNQRLDTFETASKYHFYHALALLVVGLIALNNPSKYLTYSSWSFMMGILLFSGSLYVLSITNITILGAITPIGGVFLIVGWIFLAIFAFRSK